MKVVSCYKLVPDVDTIKVNQNRTLDASTASWEIGQYDLIGVEVATRITEANDGSSLIALTAGSSITENSKLRKSILARGPQELKIVQDDAIASSDCYTVSSILAAAIKKIGDVDLVVFGEGSGDTYAQQTGSMVGAMLGWNTVNAVREADIVDSRLVVSRAIEEGNETLEITLPAVISVSSDSCIPRLASMRDILQAGKKPVVVWSLDDIGVSAGNKVDVVSILAPEQTDRMKIVASADNEDHINTVVQQLRSFM